MKSTKLAAILTALALSPAFSAETDPVGFVSVTVPANSDAVIAVPLNRAAEFKGVIQSISGNVITVAGTPAWVADAFAPGVTANKTYAVQIASGAKEGLIGRITANSNNTVTVTLDAADNLANIGTVAVPLDPDGAGPLAAQSDQIDIMPYWTPGTLFSVAPPVGFELNGFELGEAGVNFGSTEIYSHLGSNNWEDLINGGSAPHTPLKFGAALIARNNSASAYTATFVGAVPMSTSRIRLSTRTANVTQDQYIGFMSPVPEFLATAGSANALNFPAQVGDIIQGFNNATLGINKGAEELYQWNGTAWEDLINGGNVTPNTQALKPGFGYIYQKAATPSATSVVWIRTPSYLQ